VGHAEHGGHLAEDGLVLPAGEVVYQRAEEVEDDGLVFIRFIDDLAPSGEIQPYGQDYRQQPDDAGARPVHPGLLLAAPHGEDTGDVRLHEEKEQADDDEADGRYRPAVH
jgi:hypothetical protein